MEPDFNKILKEKYHYRKVENLTDMLLDAQEIYGFLTKDSLQSISLHLKMPVSKVFSVASFFDGFRFTRKGKYHIRICKGTSCHINHSKFIIDSFVKELKIQPGQTTKNGLFSLELVPCLGVCNNAPSFMINERLYSVDGIVNIKEIIENLKLEFTADGIAKGS